jgi:hypothetical protein
MDLAEHEQRLLVLQRKTFDYFQHYVDPDTGLVADSSRRGSPCSITAVGLALASYPVAVERGYLDRDAAVERVLRTLRFFWDSPQGPASDATGYRGFYYHFLDMRTGRRHDGAELSTIDTTFLVAGALAAGRYFDRDDPAEQQIRQLAEALYRRVDWQWALAGGRLVNMAWWPERGFHDRSWDGYTEALLLYVLALASPTFPVPADCYGAWTETYAWETHYGVECLWAPPLFIHQLSHVWLDFRGILDAPMRARGIDYFENSRRATHIQRRYAIDNPQGFEGYGPDAWGITASDGPGEVVEVVGGVERRFWGYMARGAPGGPDDGTLSPWGVVASLPFAPEIVLPAIDHYERCFPFMISEFGFRCSFNPTFPGGPRGWVSQGYYGLDQGPIVLMIENALTGMPWALMRGCPHLVRGLRLAGFTGGWVDARPASASAATARGAK